jgi:hypothetical protein
MNYHPTSQQEEESRTTNRRRTVTTARSHHQQEQRTQCPKLRRKAPHPITVIPFGLPPSLPTRWILQTSTQGLVHYLLYARGLIPLSVGQLYQEDASISSSSQRRKISQNKARLETWQDEWEALSSTILDHCSYILISLGPSWSRTREYYVLDATGLEIVVCHYETTMNTLTTTPTSDATSSTKVISRTPTPHALARRLLPKLVEEDATSAASDLPSRTAGSYQMWVSVWTDSLEPFWQLPQPLQDMMIRRVGFQLPNHYTSNLNNNNKPNRHQRQQMIRIELSQNSASTKQRRTVVNDEANNNNNNMGHWISLHTSVKGFRF